MTKHNKFLDDISKLASSTIATLVNIKNDLSQIVKERMKTSMKGMNLTSKSDFNNLKQSVSHLYEEVQKMVVDPNAKHYNNKGDKMATAKKSTAKKPAAKKKTAAKKTTAKKAAPKKAAKKR